MSNSKMLTILHQIHDLTIGGKLEWEQTDKEEIYQISFIAHDIRIFMNMKSTGTDFMLAIYNDNGILIDELSGTDADVEEYFGDPDQSYKFFSETYEKAREYALGLE